MFLRCETHLTSFWCMHTELSFKILTHEVLIGFSCHWFFCTFLKELELPALPYFALPGMGCKNCPIFLISLGRWYFWSLNDMGITTSKKCLKVIAFSMKRALSHWIYVMHLTLDVWAKPPVENGISKKCYMLMGTWEIFNSELLLENSGKYHKDLQMIRDISFSGFSAAILR